MVFTFFLDIMSDNATMSKRGTKNPWFFQQTCIFEQYRFKFKSTFYK